MKERVYTLDEIELVDDSKPVEREIQDLTQSDDNNILFKTVMHNPPLRDVYYDSTSLDGLKKLFDKLYIYTADQWEYLEVVFKMDLEDRFSNK